METLLVWSVPDMKRPHVLCDNVMAESFEEGKFETSFVALHKKSFRPCNLGFFDDKMIIVTLRCTCVWEKSSLSCPSTRHRRWLRGQFLFNHLSSCNQICGRHIEIWRGEAIATHLAIFQLRFSRNVFNRSPRGASKDIRKRILEVSMLWSWSLFQHAQRLEARKLRWIEAGLLGEPPWHLDGRSSMKVKGCPLYVTRTFDCEK